MLDAVEPSLVKLTKKAKYWAHKTISSHAFYYVVASALLERQSLSAVRMGDGERQLLKDCDLANVREQANQQVMSFTEQWRQRMGIEGITYSELAGRLSSAIADCDYWCPNVNGLVNEAYSLWPWVETLKPNQWVIDNFWVNLWTDEQRIFLYKEAGEILFIHGNLKTIDALQRRAHKWLGVRVTGLVLTNWDQAQTVVTRENLSDAPLVLFSAGPASKWIGPQIALQNSGRVVLDLGNSADRWTLENLDQ